MHFHGIPESLIFYGVFMIFSLILYACRWIMIKDESMKKKPSLVDIMTGKANLWLVKERGVGALHFIMFLKSILKLACFFFVISGISLGINLSHGVEFISAFTDTTSANIPADSNWHIFNLIMSFLTPCMVVFTVVQLSAHLGCLKPETKTYNRTLFIENFNSEDNIADYITNKYPKARILKVTSSSDTNDLQDLLREYEFTENILKVFDDKKYVQRRYQYRILRFLNSTKGIQYWEEKKEELAVKIKEEKTNVKMKTPHIVFITLANYFQANHIWKQENLLTPWYWCTSHVNFAPLPEEILWASVRSVAAHRCGAGLCNLCILLLVIFISTPAGFIDFVEEFQGSWAEVHFLHLYGKY